MKPFTVLEMTFKGHSSQLWSWTNKLPADRVFICYTSFLSRFSILTRDIDIGILTVRQSVRLSVHNAPVLDENGLTYCHNFFTVR